MATGLGINGDSAGNGTTTQDVQRLTAARYENAGILTGAKVFTRSDLQYLVTAGAVVYDLGSDLAAEVPVYEQLVTAPAPPTTGTATHTLYVQQNLPAVDGDSLAFVAVTEGEAPAGTIVLDRRTVPANATATSATTSTWDRRYALLSGASLGMLGTFRDEDTTPHRYDLVSRGNIRFNVPTDRWLDVRMTSTVTRCDANGATMQGNLRASLIYRIYIDDILQRSWEREYGRVWDSIQFTTTEYVAAGTHTMHYTVERKWTDPGINADNDYWAVRVGGPDQHHGDAITVFDRGVHV